jgi:hypothetical protein
MMKVNIILAAIVAIVGYATCKNLKKTEASATGAGTTAETTAMPTRAFKVPKLVEVPVDAIPPSNASKKAYLSGGWWNFNAAVGGPNEDMLIADYRAKWLKFREDLTFDILINNKVVTSGRWNWDEDKHQLYMSCADPFVNGVWGVKNSGFTMVWLGNSDYTNHGYQIRLSNSKSEPPGN